MIESIVRYIRPWKEMINCYIKVVCNPDLESRYEVTSRTDKNCKAKQLNVRLILNRVEDLMTIAKLIENQFVPKHSYDVKFSWRCTPKSVKENLEFREIMIRVFSTNSLRMSDKMNIMRLMPSSGGSKNSGPEYTAKIVELNKYIELIKNHLERHGAHPNFREMKSEKQKKKIHNYLKSVCNKPQMSREDALYLAGKIFE